MKGYILRWNPNISSWKMKTHGEVVKETGKGKTLFADWSIYDFENLEEGDFFILQQVGTDFDGIAAFGVFMSDPYSQENWRRKDGTNLFYADIRFDFVVLRDKADLILSANDLEKKFPQISWHRGHSGVLIPENIIEELVLELASVCFNQKESDENIAFPNDTTLYMLLCDMITEFCPNFKEKLLEQRKLSRKNYRDDEVIEKSLITVNFMYDKIKKASNITRENLVDYLFPEV